MSGDVVLLEKGDMIPADGVVVESMNLLVDERLEYFFSIYISPFLCFSLYFWLFSSFILLFSAMTGESDMIEKSSEAPFMISGFFIRPLYLFLTGDHRLHDL